jgi:CHAT domain-containing protein
MEARYSLRAVQSAGFSLASRCVDVIFSSVRIRGPDHLADYMNRCVVGSALVAAVLAFLSGAAAPALGQAANTAFVAPPRTIADITAILDQEKPDSARMAKLRADADAAPPASPDRHALARFYYKRAQARALLSRTPESIADAEKAISYGGEYVNELSRYEQFLTRQLQSAGDYKRALAIMTKQVDAFENRVKANKGRLFRLNKHIAMLHINMGELDRAEAVTRKNQALLADARSWSSYPLFGSGWNAEVEDGRARVLEARGLFEVAEIALRKAQSLYRDAFKKSARWPSREPVEVWNAGFDNALEYEGRLKMRQGRLVEAESGVRRALLSRLKAVGKYHPTTARMISALGAVLVEQGRYAEAEKLARTVIEIHRSIGTDEASTDMVGALGQLAETLVLKERWAEAAEVFGAIQKATSTWEPKRSARFLLTSGRIAALYNTGDIAAGIALAQSLLARNTGLFGESHDNTGVAHGMLALGLSRAGRDADALHEFKSALAILMGRSRETDDDDPTSAAARDQWRAMLVESYVALLARMGTTTDTASEAFRLVDAIRGRSVQRALTASGARASARNPAMAELVRGEQDLGKQVNAQLGLLNNVLALPPEERDDHAVKELQANIDKLRRARDAAKHEIASRFRDYAGLVEPQAPTIEEIRGILRADEAFLSFYFGRDSSFVWAVSKSGPVAFAPIGAGAAEIDSKVQKLREALEPQVSSITDIPAFDVVLAHELYKLLLDPVEAGWRPAKSLIVTTNGALGLLPLGLLTTEPSDSKTDAELLFASYRDVPWFARTHSVTAVPSAAALRTLRLLPSASEKRERMIGFGDPYFSKRQAVAAGEEDSETQVADGTSRGLPFKRRAVPQTRAIDSAQLSLLPRLPDTADELKSIALALQADPSKVLYLGKAANEEAVKKADLSKYRIIVFATHGLVPGDLNGLYQPALALTAPDVAGVPGDGLLTMEEILALKLDADWVILSACNTGAGAGAGAEAASGLGRAFFYAGTRAILVTNWSVHSASARELVSDLFRRQTADPKLTRGEALRQAMMALMNGQGFTNADGKTVFTYAHPLFWAPYTIIGDGG